VELATRKIQDEDDVGSDAVGGCSTTIPRHDEAAGMRTRLVKCMVSNNVFQVVARE
jgi:hypothetical protein